MAGAAWGALATDWAYLAEPAFRRLYQTVHDRVDVSAGTLLLDVACGAGSPSSWRPSAARW